MREKLSLWLLDLVDTRYYTLEQSHGASLLLVALDNTTLEDEASCGYFFIKTVRSIVSNKRRLFDDRLTIYAIYSDFDMSVWIC